MKIKLGENVKIDVWALLLIIAVVFLLIYFRFFNTAPDSGPSRETVKCIASKSTIYISTGCHACAAQEKLFGKNFMFLNIVDCLIEGQKCSQQNVTSVPTWFINGERHIGVQEIDVLLSLTGCS
ncbi:hypothetical protein COV19_02710 [Candidatus Woesearchaeota archaeon CG10_big_fil_rev_8_21_14_0_10_44_13]|nr:MAG: hypothetical protein COV19_02710 [Candidatus Woesearchaeota archaeon CG10_big_fil_rev_8_21_14_0_10_44_13]